MQTVPSSSPRKERAALRAKERHAVLAAYGNYEEIDSIVTDAGLEMSVRDFGDDES